MLPWAGLTTSLHSALITWQPAPVCRPSPPQLVVFHDGALERAFPRGGANEGPLRELEAAGVDYETASAQAGCPSSVAA